MANTQNLDLVRPLGTDHALVSVLNSNSDKIDAYAGAVNASLDGLRDGLGVLADGNTHAAITSGQFVYVKNHQTLPQGLYQATTNIAANGTLSTSNLVADPKGGLNTLNEQIGTLNSKLATKIRAIEIPYVDFHYNTTFHCFTVTDTYTSSFSVLVGFSCFATNGAGTVMSGSKYGNSIYVSGKKYTGEPISEDYEFKCFVLGY